MKQYEKEILQNRLDNEEYIISELEKVYKQASKDCADRIAALSARTDLENLQSIIYQEQYQRALKAEIDGLLNLLQSNSFKTVAEYLTACYQDGFIGTMYSLHKQGIPLMIPINQEAVIQAIQLDSKLSTGLYSSLGEDVAELKKAVRAEVSRGVSQGLSYNTIALGITKNFKNTPFSKALNRAKNISRTEGGRIANKSALDACYRAKKKGCSVVKQWEAALDSGTRESHSRCDGELRELDEKFSNGLMYPGDPSGGPDEVCNCRCCLLQRSTIELDEEELEILKERAAFFGLDKTENFEEFKKKYLQTVTDYGDTNFLEINSPSTKSFKKSLADIAVGKAGLSKKRQNMLDRLPNSGDYHKYEVNTVSIRDLAYLSAATHQEFALFRSKTNDVLVRGTSRTCNISGDLADEIMNKGYKWIAHSHVDGGNLTASIEDRKTLRKLKQQKSIIIGLNGKEKIFTPSEFDD